jgi:hypothetical protein
VAADKKLIADKKLNVGELVKAGFEKALVASIRSLSTMSSVYGGSIQRSRPANSSPF